MKRITIVAATLMFVAAASAQTRYMTKTAAISFLSEAKLEKIEGKSSTATSVIATNGDVAFSVLVKSFKFRQSLMEEHFNENYMESSKAGMEKSTFKGKIQDLTKVDFNKDGTYNVTVAGKLTIHGVAKDVTAPGTITVKGGAISASCKFNVKVTDYNIKIGNKVDNIAETVAISVNGDYSKM